MNNSEAGQNFYDFCCSFYVVGREFKAKKQEAF